MYYNRIKDLISEGAKKNERKKAEQKCGKWGSKTGRKREKSGKRGNMGIY
mgnify:CR=1 FL=1